MLAAKIFSAGSLLLALNGCVSDGGPGKAEACRSRDLVDANSGIALDLAFSHVLGEMPVAFDTIRYHNAAGNEFSVTHLEYLVSAFRFHDMDGKEVFRKDTAFIIDGRDSSTWQHSLRGVPNVHLSGFTFTFGLNPCLNQAGALPPTDRSVNLFWPEQWGGGYHFMKMEGHFRKAVGGISGYAAHIGSRKIPAEVVDQANHFDIGTAALHLSPAPGSRVKIDVAMELSHWFGPGRSYDFNTFGGAVMNDFEAQEILRTNGAAGVFSILSGKVSLPAGAE